MKKSIFLISAIAFFFLNCEAQNFKEVLKKTFTAFDTTKDMTQKAQLSNKLGLIAKKYPDEWCTHYYNALSKTILSYNDKDEAKRDAWLDEAEKEHDEVIAIIKKENDETYVLAAMIANARLAVKPMARWQKYGKIFEDDLVKAKEINPNNPRIYHLQGTSKFYTPKAFGGGKKAALPYFEKAQTLYANENDEDITKPSWGKEANEYFLKLAKGNDD